MFGFAVLGEFLVMDLILGLLGRGITGSRESELPLSGKSVTSDVRIASLILLDDVCDIAWWMLFVLLLFICEWRGRIGWPLALHGDIPDTTNVSCDPLCISAPTSLVLLCRCTGGVGGANEVAVWPFVVCPESHVSQGSVHALWSVWMACSEAEYWRGLARAPALKLRDGA